MHRYMVSFALLTCLTVPTTVYSQSSTVRFEVLPGSTYTSLAPGNGPITNVDVTSALEGLFSIQINDDGTAFFTDVDLFTTPIGTAVTIGPQPHTSITQYQLESIPSVTTVAVFRDTQVNIVPTTTLTLAYNTPGIAGTLTGGFDLRPVDGAGERYNAELRQIAIAIPEPTSMTVIAFSLLMVASRRRR